MIEKILTKLQRGKEFIRITRKYFFSKCIFSKISTSTVNIINNHHTSFSKIFGNTKRYDFKLRWSFPRIHSSNACN